MERYGQFVSSNKSSTYSHLRWSNADLSKILQAGHVIEDWCKVPLLTFAFPAL